MAYTNRSEAFERFSYCSPGTRVRAMWVAGVPKEPPEDVGSVYADVNLIVSDVLRLIPIVQVDTPCVKVAKVVNAQTWRGTATFPSPDGSTIITEPASWGSSQSLMSRF
jgi:hypothetical protein